VGEPRVRAAGEKNSQTFYFISTGENTQKKFSKTDFHTLQGTIFHHPLTNTSKLKFTAA
jgi:hypothetical protein